MVWDWNCCGENEGQSANGNNNSHTNLKLQYCSKTLLHVEVVRHSECK